MWEDPEAEKTDLKGFILLRVHENTYHPPFGWYDDPSILATSLGVHWGSGFGQALSSDV